MKKNNTNNSEVTEVKETVLETLLFTPVGLLTIICLFLFLFIGIVNTTNPWMHQKTPTHQETETISVDDTNGELKISKRTIEDEKEYISAAYSDITVHIGDEIFLTNDPANDQDVYVVYSIYDEKFFSLLKQQPIYQTGWFGAGEQVAFVPSEYFATGSHDINIVQTSYKKFGSKLVKIDLCVDSVKLTVN